MRPYIPTLYKLLPGEKAYTKWSKADILSELNLPDDRKAMIAKLSVKAMRENLLAKSSRHFLSTTRKWIYFYKVDQAAAEHLDMDRIKSIKGAKKPKEEARRCICSFLDWRKANGRKYPVRLTEEGYIKGKFFYRSDGSRKATDGAGFYIREAK